MIPLAKPVIGEEEKRAVLAVLDSGMLAQGAKVKEFESAFASYLGCSSAIATSSGTSALQVVLSALGIQHRDEVITTPLSFFASTSSIIYCGATPVFTDIQEDSFNMDPNEIENKITEHTRAILPVHLFGQSADMDAIMRIAKENELYVIEDACQSHGALFGDRKVGSIGDAGCFSFYPTKNMTTGEGGIITTSNEKLDVACRMLRDHGAPNKYRHESIGYNYRLNDIFAAMGIEQLKKLDSLNARRIENADRLTRSIDDLPWLRTPKVRENRNHVYHLYTIVVDGEMADKKDDLEKYLNESGVGARSGYPAPIYEQPAIKKMGIAGNCPVAESLIKRMLHIPIHPHVSLEDIDLIAEKIRGFTG